MKSTANLFKLLFISFLSITLFFNNLNAQNNNFHLVKRVIDGDTFVIIDQFGTEEKVRLIGINAPESRNSGYKQKEFFGVESKRFLSSFLTGEKVRLVFDVQKRDKYGRLLAYVYLLNGSFLNELLVKEGYAQVATYPPNVKFVDTFRNAQNFARKNRKGLWAY